MRLYRKAMSDRVLCIAFDILKRYRIRTANKNVEKKS